MQLETLFWKVFRNWVFDVTFKFLRIRFSEKVYSDKAFKMRSWAIDVFTLRTGQKHTSKVSIKGSLSVLRQFLATESSLKIMKYAL